LPAERKAKYVEQSDKLKAEYTEALSKWNEAMSKSGKAADLEKANDKIKSLKGKMKD
jgi:hypothetical protein